MKPEPGARALNAIIRDLMDTRDGATYFAARVWGIHTHYNTRSQHTLAGHSVPDFELEDGTRIGELMHDGRAILLDFKMDASIKAIADKYIDRIKYVSGRAKDQLGLSAVLIRPDGFIAWAADGELDYNELQKAVDRWFVL